MQELKKQLETEYEKAKDKEKFTNEIKSFLHKISKNINPVNQVLWVDKDMVRANKYNPNIVAKREMDLLYRSIKADGYTQPIVTIYDEKSKKYIVVDGFHRCTILNRYKDIEKSCNGKLPIVILDKDINDRMASTVRHNRARGKHMVDGMGDIVFSMLDQGMTEEQICQELGMEKDEIRRLKHITGFSKLFGDMEYKKAWETKKQIQLKKEYNERNKKLNKKRKVD
jgi:ParB-like chromosome segregation protein Spo0J